LVNVVQQAIEFSLFHLRKLDVSVPNQEVVQAGLLKGGQGALGQCLEFSVTQSHQ
jgi:hypothetical protein